MKILARLRKNSVIIIEKLLRDKGFAITRSPMKPTSPQTQKQRITKGNQPNPKYMVGDPN